MTSGYIPLGSDRLHYLRFGYGPRLVIAFHGYSNSAGLFLPFERHVENDCTVFSIDLPHHGLSTDWPDSRDFTPADIRTVVEFFCTLHGVERASLLAFSFGGRICLKIIEDMPELIERVVLAAPDGLRFNPFYYFVTRTAPGRGLFTDVLGRPQRYYRFLNALKKRGVVSPARLEFARHYLENESSRGLLRKAWPSLRYLLPRRSRVKAAIRRYKIQLHIFAGRHDHIIPHSDAVAFAKGAPDVHLHTLEKGHWVLDSDTIRDAAKALIG